MIELLKEIASIIRRLPAGAYPHVYLGESDELTDALVSLGAQEKPRLGGDGLMRAEARLHVDEISVMVARAPREATPEDLVKLIESMRAI